MIALTAKKKIYMYFDKIFLFFHSWKMRFIYRLILDRLFRNVYRVERKKVSLQLLIFTTLSDRLLSKDTYNSILFDM